MSRTSRRRIAGHTLAAASAVAAIALSGTACAAGQIAATSEQVSTVDGTSAQSGRIHLLRVALDYPDGGKYQKGEDARLSFVAVNAGDSDDRITGIRTELAATVTIAEPGSGSGSDQTVNDLALPPNQRVPAIDEGAVITLHDLSRDMYSSESGKVTFTFADAADVTLDVPVAVSTSPVPQPSPIDVEPTPEAPINR